VRTLLSVALLAALVAASGGSAAAGPAGGRPAFISHGFGHAAGFGGPHAFANRADEAFLRRGASDRVWRSRAEFGRDLRRGAADHDLAGRYYWRRDFRDSVGGGCCDYSTGPEIVAAPPAVGFVSAPIVVNVAVVPAGAGDPVAATPDGPKIIEIGRPEPPRGRMPLVIYGD